MDQTNNQQQRPSDGGPAFPTMTNHDHAQEWTTGDGMTIRDYFAAKAMDGLLCNPQFVGITTSDDGFISRRIDPDKIALNAYAIADSMLKARETVSN